VALCMWRLEAEGWVRRAWSAVIGQLMWLKREGQRTRAAVGKGA
jgi:hypothetical protein